MINSQQLNSVGLVLGMIGAAIIFKFGPPQPNLEAGFGLGLEDGNVLQDGRTVKRHNEDIIATKRRFLLMSKVGFAFIFVGFACQLWATWI